MATMKTSTTSPRTKVVEERDGTGQLQRRWLHDASGRISEAPLNTVNNNRSTRRPAMDTMKQVLRDAFLPIGYPDSVTPDYLGYQTYDSLQAFFSTITSLLANRAILEGLGVGDANSSATYALLLTILKDGISRIATIVFAYRFGLVIEPECKKYRFLADIFNDSAFFLELYSPYFPGWPKVAALVLAEALRAMCGVAAGASKAALSKHFARRNNLSELNAKESSQETAVGLVGLLVGSIVVRFVENREAVVVLMVALVLAHLVMNFLGVRCVELNVLNKQRATIVYEHYLRTKEVLSPHEVAERESIIFWDPVVAPHGSVRPVRISFASSYADAFTRAARVFGIHSDPEYSAANAFKLCVSDNHVKILLFGDPLSLPAHDTTTLQAWFAAIRVAYAQNTPVGGSESDDGKHDNRHAENGGVFKALEAAGWNVQEGNLAPSAPWMEDEAGQVKKEL